MLSIDKVKGNKREFLALTGLTVAEFKAVVPSFEKAYAKSCRGPRTLSGTLRIRASGSGPDGRLDSIEQKLLFILVYLKTYPIQVVMAKLFDMSQPRVNHWIHRLLPILKTALDEMGVIPERDGQQFAKTEQRRGAAKNYVIDGTERRRNRPKAPKKQTLHYSGKKKQHTDKNIVITELKSGRVGYLSPTRPGTVHDKKFADHEQICYPPNTRLHKDTGFQGYEPPVKKTLQPKKSQKDEN